MRLLFWRKQRRDTEDRQRGGVATVPRDTRAAPHAAQTELHGAALRFARDALVLAGARVRVDDPDLLTAMLSDGTTRRYTGSLARARAEADAVLLVPGGAALAELVADCAARAARVAFALPPAGDAIALVQEALAALAAGCGRCANGPEAPSAALCDTCPLRSGSVVLAGLGRVSAVRERQRAQTFAVELTYLATYRSAAGRRDEWRRLAYELPSGEATAVVPHGALAGAEPMALHPRMGEMVTQVASRADSDLARELEAGGAVLALQSEAEYQRRLRDVLMTYERLVSESPEMRSELDLALAAERERVADIYAVDVTAELQAVAVVASSVAEVVVRQAGGAEVVLEVDLGRGMVLPPRCAICERRARAAGVCAHGHVTCGECASGDGGACAICAGEHVRAPGAEHPRSASPGVVPESSDVAHLAALSPDSWRAFVSWYLGDDERPVEYLGTQGALLLWRLGTEATAELAMAVRPGGGRALGAADIRAAADAGAGRQVGRARLVSTGVADGEAHVEAERLGVALEDRRALREFLHQAEEAHALEIATAEYDAQRRAEAAQGARAALLDALHGAEQALASGDNTRRATGRARVAQAAEAIRGALSELERALLAWTTLLDDWQSAFDDRPGRGGALVIGAETDALEELTARAGHLRAALVGAIEPILATPGQGESGFTAWRRAVVERLTAECEALRWKVLAIDPERWHDFSAARDGQALVEAEAAATAARHAAARAEKAYTQLASRIGG
jgi:hypothetical protein